MVRENTLRGIVGLLALGMAYLTAAPPMAEDRPEVAKVASVQNLVETRAADTTDWESAALRAPLHENDRVRTGPESRAAILYADKTLHRMNEKSELEVLAPGGGNGGGVLKVISGGHYFSSRTPKDYGRIETPTVTAAIKGTEFAVDVAADGTTTISMIEGVVEASNSFGTLEIGRGEQAFVEPGKAPVRRILVRPRDAVTWTLYYPPVLGSRDADRLAGMGQDGENLVRAAGLLGAGQVDQARPLIDQALAARPGDAIALALAAVIEIADDDPKKAWDLAQAAEEADPQSPAAALAVSLAAQSRFDIALAREMAEKAATLDPDGALALARAAELRMAEGDIAGAENAAERAVRREPDNARALAVLGFVRLAQFRTKDAEALFEQAVDADPALALGRLGLGLARIRSGHLAAGREELQTAVILDPYNALLRSYLGKAYYEEKQDREAGVELAAAKELDPNDPTPYLYDAIRLQNENRPVEALSNLQKSVELNDRRAVYRSRLLLDQDRAVRSADMARVYNDLGFHELGLVNARRSADEDQSNYSAHMLLAGNYRFNPGFAPAFLSEVLQARIYQPVSVNAARPDIVSESVSFNEYTALFDRQRMRGFAGARYGDRSTDISDQIPPGSTCQGPNGPTPCDALLDIGDSNPWGIDVVGTINRDRFAGAISYIESQDDGFRFNTDLDRETLRGFFTYAASYRDTFQLNLQRTQLQNGDLPLREFPFIYTPQRFDTDLSNYALGYHRIVSPAADLAISAIYNDTDQIVTGIEGTNPTTNNLSGPQLEAQYVWRKGAATWTFGAGAFDGEDKVTTTGPNPQEWKGDDQFANAYAYFKLRDLGPVEITAGLAWEDLTAPLGLFPPRDSLIGPSALEYTDSQISPKLGVSWFAGQKTVLRLAAFRRLTPAIGRVQSLEPTQVTGFNQYFDETGGTVADSYALGWDQTFGKRVFAGLWFAYRDLAIPQAYCSSPSSFSGCGGQTADTIVDRDAEANVGTAYVNGTVGRHVALSLEYSIDYRDFDTTQVDPLGEFEDRVDTERLIPQVRVFFPFGLFTGVRATAYDQEIDKFDDLTSTDRRTVQHDFTLVDLEIGYRFPKRAGAVTLTIANLGNEQFTTFRNPIEQQISPTRTVLLGVNIQN